MRTSCGILCISMGSNILKESSVLPLACMLPIGRLGRMNLERVSNV